MNHNPNTHAGHLCESVQPDGRMQRCIRFSGHEGPHQTFVAEWNEGEASSRRRQQRLRPPNSPETPAKDRRDHHKHPRPFAGAPGRRLEFAAQRQF